MIMHHHHESFTSIDEEWQNRKYITTDPVNQNNKYSYGYDGTNIKYNTKDFDPLNLGDENNHYLEYQHQN